MRLLMILALTLAGTSAFSLGTVELEGGFAFQSRNDVRIPSSGGTELSIRQRSLLPFGRLQATLALAPRHELRALWAPYRTSATVQSAGVVNFNGTAFAANTPIDVKYQFNSYRLTYRYRVTTEEEPWLVSLGFTAKIRDAFVRFSQGASRTTNANVGFVPLLHAHVRYRLTERFQFVIDIDGLAAPQGRAVDAYLGGRYSPTSETYLGLGYRTLEGGVSNDTVRNFTWVHYFALSGGYRF